MDNHRLPRALDNSKILISGIVIVLLCGVTLVSYFLGDIAPALVLVGGILVLVFLMVPKNAVFYILAVAIPLFPYFSIDIGNNTPFYFIDIFMFMACVKIYVTNKQGEKQLRGRYFSAWCFLVLMGIVSFFMGVVFLENPLLEAVYSFVRVLLPMTTFLWAYQMMDRNIIVIERICSVLVFSSACMVLLGTALLFDNSFALRLGELLAPYSPSIQKAIDLRSIGYARMLWGLPSATSTGDLLAIIIIINLILITKKESSTLYKSVIGICAFINILGLVFTFSRHSWLAFLFATCCMFVVAERKSGLLIKRRSNRVFAVVFIVIAIIIGVQFVQRSLRAGEIASQDFESRLGLYGETIEYSEESRIGSLIKSFKSAYEQPLTVMLGGGPGNFMIVGRSGEALPVTELFAHNTFSTFMVNWGLLALITFLFMILSIIAKLLSFRKLDIDENEVTRRMRQIVVFSLLAIIIMMPIDPGLVTVIPLNAMLWFILGIGAAIIQNYKEAQESQRELH